MNFETSRVKTQFVGAATDKEGETWHDGVLPDGHYDTMKARGLTVVGCDPLSRFMGQQMGDHSIDSCSSFWQILSARTNRCGHSGPELGKLSGSSQLACS